MLRDFQAARLDAFAARAAERSFDFFDQHELGAREQLVGGLMADWTAAERRELARLMKRFAGDMNAWVLRHKSVDADGDSE